MIAIVDYGMGNLRSVQQALERVGHSAQITRSAADIAAAEDALATVDARPKELLADKGYDADDLRFELHSNGTRPVIPWKSNRLAPGRLDRETYRLRNRIERMFGFLKHFRRLATRYDKTAASFLGFIHLAAIHRWMRFVHTA